MEFRLLGPLEVVRDDGRPLSVRAGRQRALLALLLLRANELVASDRLVEDLWGDAPPPTAHKMVHNQVSALRRTLGPNGRLETRGSAYRLSVGAGERDVDRFEELMARGRRRMEVDPEGAATAFREALGLWRGPTLSDVAYESFAGTEIVRLEERRLAVFEAWVEAELALGRQADVVSELETAVAEQPLRERLHGQLMLALYRCGRQAEALEVYRRARRKLVGEVGVEPGAELRALQAAILAQDPALDLPPRPEVLPPALAGGSPVLAGRDAELAELRAGLADACVGRGCVVLVGGRQGAGKTRLAAEAAREALRRRMAVNYAGTRAPPAEALAAVRRADDRQRTTLLVVDDADDACSAVIRGAAALARDVAQRRLLLLVLHRGPEPPAAFAARAARRLQLGPLDDAAIAQITRLYLPSTTDALRVRALAAESEGVPLAVHRAAAAWARAEADERLVVSAGRAAAERGELRSAEASLAGNVIDLQAVGERGREYASEDADTTPRPAVCPFRGLATFDAAHADYFFGRERLVADLVARLVGSSVLAVVGPSGSGKSSAVRAGLLPALAGGVLPGSGQWRQVLMRPGAHPLAELERVLPGNTRAPDERVVLVVDQFEEAFTACRDEDERTAFLDALVAAARDRAQRTQVVLAMRADFYGRCASHDELARHVGANQVLVGPMRRDELRRAIELPTRRVGLRVEPSLTAALLADVLDEPGGLPLLSVALLELWRERDGVVMRRAAYERSGGVRAAVGRLAEATYTRLSEPEREAARRILLRLADAGEHEAAFVRRRMPLDELEAEKGEHTAAALATLTDSRLITVDAGAAEVAHEALLREWPRLRAWLEEDAEGRRVHQHLIHAARDWRSAGRDPGELYRGARLAAVVDWIAGHEQELNELEREFVAESRVAADLEAERQRRANRRLRGLLAGLAALLALAVVAGVVAVSQRGQARDAAVAAEAQRLGAEALTDANLGHALLLARVGLDLDDSVATRSDLVSVLLRSPAVVGELRGTGWPVFDMAVSPDGRLVATGDERGTVMVFDASTRRPLGAPFRLPNSVTALAFSPDSATLAVAGGSGPSGQLDLIDPRTGKRQLHVRLPSYAGAPGVISLPGVEYLPNGRDLVVAQFTLPEEGRALLLRRLNGRTGELEGPLLRVSTGAWGGTSATADHRLFITSPREQATYEIDAQRLRVGKRYPMGDEIGRVSPDGRMFALGSSEGRVRLLDLRSGRVRRLARHHGGGVTEMAFTPDGRTLVTGGADKEVIVWDVRRGAIREILSGHAGEVGGLVVSPDGRTAYSTSHDAATIIWDLAGDRRLARPFSAGGPFVADDGDRYPRALAVGPDGLTVALAQDDGTVALLDARTLRPRARLRALDGFVAAVAFSPDGRLLAVTGKRGQVTLWDARTLRPTVELKGLPAATSQALAFTPDSRLLAAAVVNVRNARGNLRVWDVRRHALTDVSSRLTSPSLAFSPDGRLLAAAAMDRGIEIRDAHDGGVVAMLRTDDIARSVAFSPDGRRLAGGQFNGKARLWSTTSWKPVGRALEGHAGRVTEIEFTRDGRMLTTASQDGTVRLWDAATQKPIGAPLILDADAFTSAVFTPTGSHLFAVTDTGRGVRWDVSLDAWERHACRVAGRELTPREWQDALPGRSYRTVCRRG